MSPSIKHRRKHIEVEFIYLYLCTTSDETWGIDNSTQAHFWPGLYFPKNYKSRKLTTILSSVCKTFQFLQKQNSELLDPLFVLKLYNVNWEPCDWSALMLLQRRAHTCKLRPGLIQVLPPRNWVWASHLNSLCFRSFICKMKVIIPAFYLPHRDVVECKR